MSCCLVLPGRNRNMIDRKTRKKKQMFILTMLLSSLILMQEALATPEVMWEYRLRSGHFDSSPAVGDLLQDGRPEIVVASTAGYVLVLDSGGNLIWQSSELGDFITVSPTLADVTGDGSLEVLAVSNAGRLVCLDGRRGSLLWEYGLNAPLKWAGTSIVAADLANDGQTRLVLGDSAGVLTCLDAQGRLAWQHRESAAIVTSPAVGDLTGDGALEILFGTRDTPLVCVSASGETLWRLEENGAVEASPVVWDLTGDGQLEVLAGVGKTLTAVDAQGRIIWSCPMKGVLDTAIAVADLDGDSKPEIIAVDLTGQVLCLGGDGAVRWEGTVEQRARRSPAIADINGDGNLEILIAGYSAALHVFSSEGTLLERIDLGAHKNASPTVANLDGDGRLSVITVMNSAYMRVFRWPAPEGTYAAPWPQYRLNAARVASIHGHAAIAQARFIEVDFGSQYSGWNTMEATVANPAEQEVSIRLEVQGLGQEPLVEEQASAQNPARVELRYALDGQHAYNLAFTATLRKDSRVLDRRTHAVYAAPLQREWADVLFLLDRLEEHAPLLRAGEHVEAQAILLRTQAETLRTQVEQASALPLNRQRELSDQLHTLIETCRRWYALTEAALRADGLFAVHGANPWAPFGDMDELVEGRSDPAALDVNAFRGSMESAALNLFSFADRTQSLRIEVSDFTCPGNPDKSVRARKVLSLHEVVEVPTQMLDLAPDALPVLNQAQIISVPPWQGRQLWLRLDTRALDAPGIWQAELRLHPLAVGAEPVVVPLNLTVWEAALPREQALRLCTWAYVHRSPLSDQPEAALADQIAHGSSIFVSPFPPKAEYDEQGDIVSMDFADHDAHVLKHGPHGILLQSGYTHAMTGPAPLHSDVWRKAHVAYLRRWVAHMESLGLGYQDYALYPMDEPGLTEGSVDTFMIYAELAKEADEHVQVYANPVGGATLEDLKRMTPCVDIWAPHRFAYMLGVGHEKLEYLKSLGKTLWTYECEANVKHQSPLAYYRAYAWHAWQHGMTGIGFWTYCTASDNPWHEPAGANSDYQLVYPGNGIVTSKRWEAVRDAITDYTMLDALRRAADRAAADGQHPQIVAEAYALLGEGAAEIAAFNGVWSDKHGPGTAGAPAERRRADLQWKRLQTIRADMARLIAVLSQN